MKYFIALALIFGLTCYGYAQHAAGLNLPDAPSTVQPPPAFGHAKAEKKESSWTYLHDGTTKARTNKEVAQVKSMWVIDGVFMASQIFDAEMTHEGLAHHRCVERNVKPPYPNRYDLYRADLLATVMELGLNAFSTKAKMPGWLPLVWTTYPVESHIRGGLNWYEHCW
jgi:hypothetical protein